MSTEKIDATSGSHKPPPHVDNGGFREAMAQSLSLVATRLGMSVSDLRAQMQFGKTPADVAAERGMSQGALLGVIKESLGSSDIATGPRTADAIASRIANFKEAGQGSVDTQRETASQSTHDSDKDDIVAR